MKSIRLNKLWIERLAQLPESGMGYQKVEVLLKGGRVVKNVIVLNAEECQTTEEFDPAEIVDLRITD